MTSATEERTEHTIWLDLLGTQVRYLGNEYKTRVIEYGQGEPLLLIHGNGGHAEAYARNLKTLGAKYRVMAMDLLWHGMSAKPEWQPDMVPTYARQVLDLLDSEGIEKAHIEGESLGGWVGLWLALHHPDRVGKLILNTNAGIKFNSSSTEEHQQNFSSLRERSIAAFTNPTRETIRKRVEWLVLDPKDATDELVELRYAIYNDPATRERLIKIAENSFGFGSGHQYSIEEDRLADITADTLVLWSSDNPGHGPDVGRKIADLIPGAKFHVVDQAAHWPQWEKPEDHDTAVLTFLDGTFQEA